MGNGSPNGSSFLKGAEADFSDFHHNVSASLGHYVTLWTLQSKVRNTGRVGSGALPDGLLSTGDGGVLV